MTRIAEDLLEDLKKETVDFVPNYDGTREEPLVLPAKLPNLLMNGAAGIAVGMATNIPPHNLEELTKGIVAIIEDPKIPDEKLLDMVHGPDFPTGGIIFGRGGVRDAYLTGRGRRYATERPFGLAEGGQFGGRGWREDAAQSLQ